MLIRAALTVAALLLCVESSIARETYGATSKAGICESITNSKSGTGVAYRGTLRNSDYGISLQIPSGQTGWGAAPEAPFHGFAIFFDDQSKSCISFEIHLRVDAGDSKSMSSAPSAKRVRLGNRNGWEERNTDMIDGVEWTNITVRFSMHHVRSRSEIDDGSITLVTPTRDKGRNMSIFQEFITHIRFEGRELITSGTDANSVGRMLQGG
jgi:hypothetical protein